MPVFFLFFAAHLSVAEVLVLEAVYYAAVVGFEVPSGYLSDRLGRRPTLLCSAVALCMAYGCFLAGAGFPVFVAGQVFLAIGIACHSGTDVAFHHDALEALGRAEEFDRREARAARLGFAATAGAAVAGGLLAAVDLRLVYAASLATAIGQIVVVRMMTEPPVADPASPPERNVVSQIGRCLGDLARRPLGWLFAVAVLTTVINHVPYELFQPYVGLLFGAGGNEGRGGPIVAGLHAAAVSGLAAIVAGRSIVLRDRIGLGPTMLLSVAIQGLVMAAMAAVLHPLLLVVILARGIPRAIMRAPMNAAIAPAVPSSRRATYFSIQSFAGRLAFSGFLVVLSLAAGGGESTTWPVLSRLSWIGALAALAGGILLALTMRRGLGPPVPTAGAPAPAGDRPSLPVEPPHPTGDLAHPADESKPPT